MCSSYLIDMCISQSVSDHDFQDLLNLIRLGFTAPRLQVNDLVNPVLEENMMVAFDSDAKAKLKHKAAKHSKVNVGTKSPLKYRVPQRAGPDHSLLLPDVSLNQQAVQNPPLRPEVLSIQVAQI